MSYIDQGYDPFFRKLLPSDLRAYSAADYDAYFEDQSITPEKMSTLPTNASSVQAKTSSGTTLELIKLDSSDYVIVGSEDIKGIRLYNKVKCRVHTVPINSRTIGQPIPGGGVERQIDFYTVDYNPLGCFSLTSSNFTAPISGYYLVNVGVEFRDGNKSMRVVIKINGVTKTTFRYGASDTYMQIGSDILYLNANQYIGIWAENTSSTTTYVLDYTFLSVHLLSV